MARVLERHRELLRAAFDAHGGSEVGTEGDSFFAVFPTRAGAVAAAVDVQRALGGAVAGRGVEMRVRIGLHTGEASLLGRRYVGLTSTAPAALPAWPRRPGAPLDATRAARAGSLPDGVGLRDLGEHRLKDLEHPERLWQLVITGCGRGLPTLACSTRRRTTCRPG